MYFFPRTSLFCIFFPRTSLFCILHLVQLFWLCYCSRSYGQLFYSKMVSKYAVLNEIAGGNHKGQFIFRACLAGLLTRGSSAFYSKTSSPEKCLAGLLWKSRSRRGALPNRALSSADCACCSHLLISLYLC